MSKKKNSTEDHANDLFESPEALAERLTKTEEFIENNKGLVSILGIVVAIILAGFVFGKYYLDNQNANGQRDMFQAVYYFEADSLGLALNGDGNNFGFLEIIDAYPMTDAANLSNFYAGAIYLKMGDFDNAVRYMEDFSSSDYLVQGRAYDLIGEAQMELQNFDKAASSFEKAANYNANKELSPTYLQKAAIANEFAGNLAGALSNYQTILDEYVGVTEYQDAKKHAARLKGMIN